MASLTRGGMGYLSKFTKVLTKTKSNYYKTRQNFIHCSSFFYGPGQEIKMPSLSPTMMEGKIVKWLKKEGDTINPGDVLCDIETDKAIVSMEVEEEGILAKILVPENSSQIKVGSLIALMVSEGEDWKSVDIPSGIGAEADSSTSSSSSSSSDSDSNDEATVGGPPTFLVKMPSLSPTMTAGTIVKWLKAEGDTVAPGDVLCDIQTDKAVMSLEAEEEGILAKIITPDDSKDIKVGTLIALIVPEGEDWKSAVVPAGPSGVKSSTAEVQQPQSVASTGSGDARGKSFGPAVKVLLSTYQLEPGLIKPSGRNNRLLKEDVLKYIEDNKVQKKPPKTVSSSIVQPEKPKPKSIQKDSTVAPSKYIDIELNSKQQAIAKKLVQSKLQIPHSYSVANCNVTKLLEAQDYLSNAGISMNDLLAKATALALQIYPKANALCINNEVRLSKDVDLCVVVANGQGLFSPILKSANLKSVTAISEEIRNLKEKEKSGNLKPEELEGGTFTIFNLGEFGVSHFRAVINPPQCGVLAVGGTMESFNTDLVIQKHITLTLSYDRRALQEHEAAEFMETVKYLIENPNLMSLDVNRKAAEMNL